MMRLLILVLALAYCAAAGAQLYRWVDKDGRVRYTDRPPPAGVKARTIATPSAPEAAADPAAKDAGGRPLTPAEQEQAFRKRRLEAQKADEKAAATAREQEIKQANCSRARETLATLQSGQRIGRTDAKGERYYLDDEARERESEAARQAVQDWCG